MKYLCLIYSAEADHQGMSPSAQQEYAGSYFAFDGEVKKAGVYVAGEGLKPVGTATTVRVRDGKRSTTDGPFAETKEQLGGFYLLDCKNLDEALSWATKIPTAKFGSIEVRPVMVYE